MTRPVMWKLTVAALVAASASLSGATGARAGFSCLVPRALLCEGCASQIAITLRRDGSCRISFAPPSTAAAPSTLAVSPQVDLDFEVEVAPPLGPAGRTNRIYAKSSKAGSVARLSWLRAVPQSRCFVFNGQRYCE
jgi:hypothetical protein